jgi:hypothetical protein
LHATYQAVSEIYVRLDPLFQQLAPWIMPEDFWFYGYEERDQDRMDAEVAVARQKVDRLDARCSQYSDEDLARLELGYAEMLKVLAKLENRS